MIQSEENDKNYREDFDPENPLHVFAADLISPAPNKQPKSTTDRFTGWEDEIAEILNPEAKTLDPSKTNVHQELDQQTENPEISEILKVNQVFTSYDLETDAESSSSFFSSLERIQLDLDRLPYGSYELHPKIKIYKNAALIVIYVLEPENARDIESFSLTIKQAASGENSENNSLEAAIDEMHWVKTVYPPNQPPQARNNVLYMDQKTKRNTIFCSGNSIEYYARLRAEKLFLLAYETIGVVAALSRRKNRLA